MSSMPEPEDLGPPSPILPGEVVAERYLAGERYAVRGDVHLHHGASEDGLVRIAAFKYRGSEPLPRFLEYLRLDADDWGALAPAENGRLPVIVPTLDIGRMVSTTTCFWIQDDARGPSLSDRLELNPRLTPHYAIHLARQIGDALRTIHGGGLVHGDLDPSNVAMLANFDLVRLAWGGMATRLEAAGMDAGRGGSRTLAEVAPEVLQGRAPDPRSDLYALCALLFRMLAGQPPWLVRKKGPLPGITDADPLPPLPEWAVSPLPEVLAVGLQRDPSRRPDTIADWLDHLEEAAERFRDLPAAPGTWAPSASGGLEPTPPTVNRTLSPAQDTEHDPALSNTPPSSIGRTFPPVPPPMVRSIAPAPQRTETPIPMMSPLPVLERSFFEPKAPPPAPRWPLALLSMVVVALIALAVWAAYVPDPLAGERPMPTESSSASAPSAAAVPSALTPAVAPKPVVTLRTHPPGARVFEGNVEIGVTPVEIPLTGSSVDPPRRFTLRLKGYAPHTVSQGWSASPVEHTVTLQPVPGQARPPGPRELLPLKENR